VAIATTAITATAIIIAISVVMNGASGSGSVGCSVGGSGSIGVPPVASSTYIAVSAQEAP
jgi:hypothetical protein